MHRRRFLVFGLAGGLSGPLGLGIDRALSQGPTVLRQFTHSPTVVTFARGLFFGSDDRDEAGLPRLLQMIDAEFVRTGTPTFDRWEYRPGPDPAPEDSEADKIERRRAAFFSRLAVEYIAPRALRRAGFEQMAADVASGALPPAAAQHTIGQGDVRRCRVAGTLAPMPKLESCAYGASAHASTTAFYATRREIDSVHQTGYYCARALIDASFCDDEVIDPDPTWAWNIAALAINAAIGLHDPSGLLLAGPAEETC